MKYFHKTIPLVYIFYINFVQIEYQNYKTYHLKRMFFENYYMSIEHISDALSVVVLSAYALIFRKDKYCCIIRILLLFDGLYDGAKPFASKISNASFFAFPPKSYYFCTALSEIISARGDGSVAQLDRATAF